MEESGWESGTVLRVNPSTSMYDKKGSMKPSTTESINVINQIKQGNEPRVTQS